MKKIIMLIALMFIVATPAFAEVNAVTPSTNDINRGMGWAHVSQISVDVGEVELEFISTRGFASCFEYRTDGDTSQASGDNYNTDITDGLYPFFCQNNNSRVETITANEYVEIRMVFGAERDERFDWTRFDVLQPPTVVGTFNGGGHMLEGEKGAKRKDMLDVSFGGWANLMSDDSVEGSIQVNLHNVSKNDLDKGSFHGTDFVSMTLYDGNSVSCNDAMNFLVNGTFNGEPNHSMWFRAGDYGSPNTKDTVRVTIYKGPDATGGELYDTYPSDFPGDSDCVGSARTGLDNGNITIWQE